MPGKVVKLTPKSMNTSTLKVRVFHKFIKPILLLSFLYIKTIGTVHRATIFHNRPSARALTSILLVFSANVLYITCFKFGGLISPTYIRTISAFYIINQWTVNNFENLWSVEILNGEIMKTIWMLLKVIKYSLNLIIETLFLTIFSKWNFP